MQQNNVVYKGYRLTARVDRPVRNEGDASVFTATIFVGFATGEDLSGHRYMVPQFEDGHGVYSASEAVRFAIQHGRSVVDGFRSKRPA